MLSVAGAEPDPRSLRVKNKETRIRFIMRRRDFLQGMAASAASLEILSGRGDVSAATTLPVARKTWRRTADAGSLEGYTPVIEFNRQADSWKVYEDLRTREGS